MSTYVYVYTTIANPYCKRLFTTELKKNLKIAEEDALCKKMSL